MKRKSMKRNIAKTVSLLAIMFAVTTAVVAFETGHLDEAFKVACFASPLKMLAAQVHGWCWGESH